MPNVEMLVLAAALEDPSDRLLAESILGTADPVAIGESLRHFCRANLGDELIAVTLCAFSVGAGFALTLASGSRVFLKAWSASTSQAELRAVHVVEQALAEQGYPGPRVLVAPTPFMAGHASVLEWLDRGAQASATDPAVRRAMAAALARLIHLAATFAELTDLPHHHYPDDAVWGATHNVLFDFTATAAGAAWIDAIAAANADVARQSNGKYVVGHQDWSTKNIRVEHTAGHRYLVSAVYDWDSLLVAREPVIVGMAAATFLTTWDIAVARRFPTREDMTAFVTDYELASGRMFTADEWRTTGAAATHNLAYTARCEHCLAPEHIEPDSARAILRSCVAEGRTSVFDRRGPA